MNHSVQTIDLTSTFMSNMDAVKFLIAMTTICIELDLINTISKLAYERCCI